jgi:hypothetical protein
LVHFSGFGIMHQEKSGNPGTHCKQETWSSYVFAFVFINKCVCAFLPWYLPTNVHLVSKWSMPFFYRDHDTNVYPFLGRLYVIGYGRWVFSLTLLRTSLINMNNLWRSVGSQILSKARSLWS